jgi:spoIIIJ-associated protein
MEWIETTGRTIDEAKEAALDELGVDEADAEFEIVAEPQTGLFGRLRGEARVRARVRPTAPRAKGDRRDRRRRSPAGPRRDEGEGNGGTSGSEASAAGGARNRGTVEAARGETTNSAESPASPGGTGQRVSAGARGGSTGGGRRSAAGGSGSAGTDGSGRSPEGEDEADRSSSRRRRRRRGGASQGGAGAADRDVALGDDESYDEAEENGLPTVKGTEVEVPLDQQAEVAVEFLTKLTAEFGLDARVSVTHPDEDTVELQMSGSDLGILIGPKGATLIALQNLTRTVVFNETGANNGHINVDVGGYRQKRTEALVRFATQVAEKVKESGTRTALEPMSAVDRKIVHDTVSGIDGVSTTSEGEEPRRRVVVFPG